MKVACKRSQQKDKSKAPIKEPFTLSSRTTFDPNLRILFINGVSQELSVLIAQVLELFCLNRNQSVSNKYICQYLVRLLQNYIVVLRRYLETDSDLKISTNHGCGYTFSAPF